MKLEFIAFDKLSVSKSNMRCARKMPDMSDVLPTVRPHGHPVVDESSCLRRW